MMKNNMKQKKIKSAFLPRLWADSGQPLMKNSFRTPPLSPQQSSFHDASKRQSNWRREKGSSDHLGVMAGTGTEKPIFITKEGTTEDQH